MTLDTNRLADLADRIYVARLENETDKENARTCEYVRAIEEASFPGEWVLPPERISELQEHNPKVFRAVIAPEPWHRRLGRAVGSTMIYPIEDEAYDEFATGGNLTWYDMDANVVCSTKRMQEKIWARSVFIDVVVSLPRLLGEPLRGFGSQRLLDEMYCQIAEFIPRMYFTETGELVHETGDELPRCGCCTDDRGISETLCNRAAFRRVKRDRTGMGRRTLDLEDYNKPRVAAFRKDRIRKIVKALINRRNKMDQS
jgi:hypothetical protein